MRDSFCEARAKQDINTLCTPVSYKKQNFHHKPYLQRIENYKMKFKIIKFQQICQFTTNCELTYIQIITNTYMYLLLFVYMYPLKSC